MKLFFKIILLFVISSSINSCIPLKDLKYLQDNENLVLNENGLIQSFSEPYRLRIDDLIKVHIETTDPDAALLFGKNVTVTVNKNISGIGNAANSIFYFDGIQIKPDGKINIYGIGYIDVVGLTADQAAQKIQVELDKTYIPGKSIAHVYLEGINFTIMGEVGNPGPKNVTKFNLNLLEALALSGDLTHLADRKHIHIYRQYPEGMKRTDVDITQNNILNSKYFNLHPNDIIIVDPRKEKVTGLGGGTTLGDVTQILTLTIQALTFYLFFQRL